MISNKSKEDLLICKVSDAIFNLWEFLDDQGGIRFFQARDFSTTVRHA